MDFDEVLQKELPGAMPVPTWSGRSRSALGRLGFAPGAALACVITCPDEICDPFRHEMRRVWGHLFDGSALAGVPVLGRDGFGAALGHAPERDGRRRLVCVVMAHVAIDAAGNAGPVQRPGLAGPSSACGALARLRSLLAAGEPPVHDPDNPGVGALWAALEPALDTSAPPDLWRLTRAALAVAPEVAERHLGAASKETRADYALLAGLQVHGPVGREYVWPTLAVAVTNGERRSLDFP